ncbi:MAG: ATP synthase F1 subunit gamma [Candidatus Doudnabacteria bacterium RIFCSPHIGHO2_01_FULL_43_23]|uniref:ATP synthase gamma chain n=1 Tax=Candidatus Doudnabacteria bacterium RIFCSPHIGHO2_01_FULL_43_23 TaxID=1817822 RepID=A0A1F5NT28_9BACT|nr:MAG: ATP synthase F1 subunit gamma [Candidatus Doudnabacteria bacterium RIFCSPHIGHO2_01_FULL_43_23]
MPNTLGIRRRIRSVKNTRQITKAMELVAATKMRRTQTQAVRARIYAQLAWELINNLSGKIDRKIQPLLRLTLPVKKQLIILLTSNRGLAGSFNSQIIGKILDYITVGKDENSQLQTDLIVVGKKGADAMFKARQNIVADFKKADVNLEVSEIFPIATLIIDKYSTGQYDKVILGYSDFVSTLVQKPRIKVILPFPELSLAANIAEHDDLGQVGNVSEQPIQVPGFSHFDYIFEPTPDTVLKRLLPRLIEVQIYQAMLESNASEHSARMVAMKSASDAAADLIEDLTLEYNQLRQAGITAEIAEISAGRMAVT